MKPKRRRLASVEVEIARVAEPLPMLATVEVQPLPTYEVIQTHPATCRVNLLAWDLTGPEASRILDELEVAQRARQGAILVGEKAEHGWTYLARPHGQTP